MRRLLPACLLAAFLASVAIPAGAQEVPTFRTERVYFRCLGDNKVQNVPMLNGEIPGWNTDPPAGSVTGGNGCGMYENAVNAAGLNLDFKGSFTGNLDNLTVELHNIFASAGRPNHQVFMRVVLDIDGEVFESALINFPSTASATGLSEKVAFTFTGLNYENELGDGTQVREIHFTARSGQETQSIWVWDTTEVPAGLTFNPTTPESFKIAVDRIP